LQQGVSRRMEIPQHAVQTW